MDHYGASLEIKSVDKRQRIIIGHAAANSNLDRVRDIIEPDATVKAVNRVADLGKIGIYIAHNYGGLPMGVPVALKATPRGMYTESLIKPGVFGDDLLDTAEFLAQHGQALGMSIGYHTLKSRPDRIEGKLIRRILDYDLEEYSFASQQMIANPLALVTGVKAHRYWPGWKAATETGDDATYHLEARDGRYHVLEADGSSLIDYATEVEATAALAALRADAVEDADEPAATGKTDPPQSEVKTEWSTAMVDALPDSSFLMISPGGQQDSEGKTVPRGLRHFPYRDAEGKLDLAHLRDAVGHIPRASGLDTGEKARLQARARKLLEDVSSGKTVADGDGDRGVSLTIRALGYELIDLSDALAGEHKAMALLGEDIKGGERIRAETRAKLAAVGSRLASAVAHAAAVDSGEDALHKLALFRQQLALTEV